MNRTTGTEKSVSNNQNRIFTIPNILSAIRLLMVPILVWMYCVKENFKGTGYLLLLSGFTDIADGFIARTFHMTSNLGKILDPIADKLTHAAMLFCLVTRFPLMLAPLILMVFKELFMAVTGYLFIKRTGHVFGAKWHGKLATFLLDATMVLHVFWYDIPTNISNGMIILCIIMMVVSLVLYGKHNLKE